MIEHYNTQQDFKNAMEYVHILNYSYSTYNIVNFITYNLINYKKK